MHDITHKVLYPMPPGWRVLIHSCAYFDEFIHELRPYIFTAIVVLDFGPGSDRNVEALAPVTIGGWGELQAVTANADDRGIGDWQMYSGHIIPPEFSEAQIDEAIASAREEWENLRRAHLARRG